MIQLARECNALQFLPMAFYHLALNATSDTMPIAEASYFGYDDLRKIHLLGVKVQQIWLSFLQHSADLNPEEMCSAGDDGDPYQMTIERGCPIGTVIRRTTRHMEGVQVGSKDSLGYFLAEEVHSGVESDACSGCLYTHRALCRAKARRILRTLSAMFNPYVFPIISLTWSISPLVTGRLKTKTKILRIEYHAPCRKCRYTGSIHLRGTRVIYPLKVEDSSHDSTVRSQPLMTQPASHMGRQRTVPPGLYLKILNWWPYSPHRSQALKQRVHRDSKHTVRPRYDFGLS